MKKILTILFILSLIMLIACSSKETAVEQKTEEPAKNTAIQKETTPPETTPIKQKTEELKTTTKVENTTTKKVTGSASVEVNKQHVIKITKEEFNPEKLTIKTGDTVTFENTRTGTGVTKAIITANKYPCKGVFPITTIETGKTYSVTFEKAMNCVIVESVYDQSIKPLELTIQ